MHKRHKMSSGYSYMAQGIPFARKGWGFASIVPRGLMGFVLPSNTERWPIPCKPLLPNPSFAPLAMPDIPQGCLAATGHTPLGLST